jgi:hypothetical protein
LPYRLTPEIREKKEKVGDNFFLDFSIVSAIMNEDKEEN